MPGQMRQEAGAVHMQPMQHPIHADAGLIGMLESAGSDQIGNALDCGSQTLCCQFAPLDQGGFRDLAPTDRRERLAGASRWEQLPLVQIHGQRLQVGTILHWGADRSRKAATVERVTVWATDGFDLMFLDQQANFRHVQDLTAFCDAAWDSAEILTVLAADLGTMTHHCIWLLHHRQRVPRVSSLTSRTLAARTTRTAWQARQPIRRGRLTARSTIFGQSVFEFLDILCLHLIQVSLALVNTLLLQEVLAEEKWKQAMKQEDWRGLTPLFYQHVNPYGHFTLDMTKRIPLSQTTIA
jgi:hypothetical protein